MSCIWVAQAAQSGQLHCGANEEVRGQGNQEISPIVSCFDDPRIGMSELWFSLYLVDPVNSVSIRFYSLDFKL